MQGSFDTAILWHIEPVAYRTRGIYDLWHIELVAKRVPPQLNGQYHITIFFYTYIQYD